MKIDTLDDAKTYVGNSGPGGWDDDGWGGAACAAGWAEWIFRNCASIDGELDFECALRGYLMSEGQNPDQYGV